MKEFKTIFNNTASWGVTWNKDADLVDGVKGDGNKIFKNILESINKYLGNNVGSVIDFGLLKDAVDRHFDSVEDEISTQTPIPLYWGLAGTMAGVIVGLFDLLHSDSILTLMGSNGGEIDQSARNAAAGINSLLKGVAWAMVASICGIIFTTISSLKFKACKLKAENGKNSFLAWMQAKLLPNLPSDTSDALNNLVKNLNRFNNTFSNNTAKLGDALYQVNESYRIQAEIITAVHDMDVMKMANANVRVLKELSECTEKLEEFNEYLIAIDGYTEAIHKFEEQYNQQCNKVRILEEIRDFFHRHKGEIARTVSDADNELQESLKSLKETTALNVSDLNKNLLQQSQDFKDMLGSEKEMFEKFTSDLRVQFSEQMNYMPQMAKKLSEVSEIPKQIEKLIDRIEKSNHKLAKEIAETGRVYTPVVDSGLKDDSYSYDDRATSSTTPNWMKITGLGALIIIALGCIFNIVILFFPLDSKQSFTPTTDTIDLVEEINDTTRNSDNRDITKSISSPKKDTLSNQKNESLKKNDSNVPLETKTGKGN